MTNTPLNPSGTPPPAPVWKKGMSGAERLAVMRQHTAYAKATTTRRTLEEYKAYRAANAPAKPAPVKAATTRSEDWPEKMAKHLDDKLDTPFAWGSHDCGLFVSDLVQQMTGVDLAADIRGQYSTATGAAKAMAKVCGSASLEDYVAFVAKKLGIPELTNVKLASRGDVVLIDGPEGAALGFVHLDGRNAAVVSDKGMRFHKTEKVRRAWRIS